MLMVFNWHIYIMYFSLSLLSTNSKLHWFWPTQHRPLAGQPHSHTGRWSKRGGSCGVGTRLYSPGIQGPTFLHWNADQLSCFFTWLGTPQRSGSESGHCARCQIHWSKTCALGQDSPRKTKRGALVSHGKNHQAQDWRQGTCSEIQAHTPRSARGSHSSIWLTPLGKYRYKCKSKYRYKWKHYYI